MKNFLLYLIAILILSGCVYYNTFYNAENYFAQAQKDALTAKGTPSRNAIQNYNKAMKKCGIVITDYPKSKWVDDAMFMISQCLFYKQKYIQAKEKFEEVIESVPGSEFAERSHIYIARCDFEMGRHEKAYQKLRDYLVLSNSTKYKVEAIKLLAEFYLENEEFSEAEFYYQKIIDEYTKSDFYKEAFFSLGLLYHRNDNFQESINIFEDFLKIKAEKKLKLDARYYILKNLLMAGQYQETLNKLTKLMRSEYREDEIIKLQILQARALAMSGETDMADIIFEKVIKEKDKTLLAAESSFWRAEMHFRILNNYELAIEYYNAVKTHSSNSPFVEDAVSHSAVASQIVQYNSSKANIELRQLISEQMKLAEYYLEVLDLPDSAMTVYDNIISYKDSLMIRLDSLQIEKTVLEELSPVTELDSLFTDIEMDTLSADTLNTFEPVVIADTVSIPDSLTTIDTLALSNAAVDTVDVLEDSLSIVLVDTTVVEEIAIEPTRLDTLKEEITNLESQIELYNLEFVPYIKFVKLWMFKNVYQDSSRTMEFYDQFTSSYPDNKYSHAAQMLMNDQKVEFVTFSDIKKRKIMNQALDMFFTFPDSAEVILSEIALDTTHTYYKKAVFSLAYLQYYIKRDTTAARPYFEEVLTWQEEQEWINSINQVYSDSVFLQYDRLPALVELEEQKAAEAEEAKKLEEEANQDSTEEAIQDSTEEELILELEEIESNPDMTPQVTPPRSLRPKE